MIGAHLPAFAVPGFSPGCGRIRREESVLMRSNRAGEKTMWTGRRNNGTSRARNENARLEFLKNSINIDKFTGFFDKFLNASFP